MKAIGIKNQVEYILIGSFLDFGIPPSAPSWGGMLSGSGRGYMFMAPWPGFLKFSPLISRLVWCHDCNRGQHRAPQRRLMLMEQNFRWGCGGGIINQNKEKVLLK